jgi:hypothetical protein
MRDQRRAAATCFSYFDGNAYRLPDEEQWVATV